MILVTSGDRCLLARQPGFPAGMFSALAGFVEPGESVEECVRREAREEVGLEVGEFRYFRSQSWPFPQSLMIGFNARAESEAFVLDRDELEDARWFSRQELRQAQGFFYPPPVSLAHHMIQAFISGAG
jgi:NAD+ diphosphatase